VAVKQSEGKDKTLSGSDKLFTAANFMPQDAYQERF